jgi:metal-responsive CopG/Arc/MetJ family transcriptional regulator
MSQVQRATTTESVSVSIPSFIIEEMDEICARRDFTRSNFVVRALKQYIAKYHSDSNLFWDYLAMARDESHVRK